MCKKKWGVVNRTVLTYEFIEKQNYGKISKNVEFCKSIV